MADTAPALILRWLGHLSLRCVPARPGDDQEPRLRAYAADFVRDGLPPSAFTEDSLSDLAKRFAFFPAYADLHAALVAWVEARAPAPAALPYDYDPPGLSGEDRAALFLWNKRRLNDFAPQGMAFWAGFYRRYHPGAFQVLLKADASVLNLARRRGWLRDTPPETTRADEEARVSAAVRVAASHMRPDADAPRQTQLASDAFVAAFERTHGRKPGQLSPEQQADARRRAGIAPAPPPPPDPAAPIVVPHPPDPDDRDGSPFGWDTA